MRALALALALVLGVGLFAVAAVAPAVPARTTAVGVATREFRIALYRERVRRGTVKLNITNLGEDPHDVVVRSPRGRVLARSPELRAGEHHTLRFRARVRGRYVLACTLADHEERGMRSRLRVR